MKTSNLFPRALATLLVLGCFNTFALGQSQKPGSQKPDSGSQQPVVPAPAPAPSAPDTSGSQKPGPIPAPAPAPAPVLDFKKCPDDHDKNFSARDGTLFTVKCHMHCDGTIKISDDQKFPKIDDCMNICASHKDCKSITYWRQDGNCTLWSDQAKSFATCGYAEGPQAHDCGLIIDNEPSESLQQDDVSVTCATECPSAHGQIYDTVEGKRFHITCNKRHGTITIYKEKVATFKACMDKCGSFAACQSVDWRERTGICYLGKHSGMPGLDGPGFMSAYSIGCAGACGGGCNKPAKEL